MKFGILIKIFFFIAFPIYSLDFSLILGSSKYQSEKTLSLGTKLNFFIFTQAQDCFFSFCRTGTGAEIFYPSFLWNLELGIRFYSNRYTFTITGEYGESENLKGAYDIDFNTYIFTKYRKYSFTNIFNLKETIYDWKDYLIFFRSESHLIHRIYKLNFLYENQITNLFSLLFNGELEKSFYSLLNAYSIIPFRNFLLSNVNYLYNDYYIFSTGFSWYLFKNIFFNFQIGALFSLGVLHFDFYHTFRYLY